MTPSSCARALAVLIVVCCGLVGLGDVALAAPVSCKVQGHTTPGGSWKTTTIHLVEKNFTGLQWKLKQSLSNMFPVMVPTHAFPLIPKNRLPSADAIQKLYQANLRKRNFVKLLMKDTFALFRRYGYPFPKRWGMHKNGVIEVYCGGSSRTKGSTLRTVGGMATWEQGDGLCKGGPNPYFMTLHLNDVLFQRLGNKPYDMVETVAHEVFHILQFHGTNVRSKSTFPMWWKESTARAIGNYFTTRLSSRTRAAYRKAFGRALPAPPNPDDLGERSFHRYPLDFNGASKGSQSADKDTTIPYLSEAFWRHVATYELAGTPRPYRFLKDILYDPSAKRLKGFDTWLTLSHKSLLKWVKRPLSHIFGTFLTRLAARQRRKVPTGLLRWFGKCAKTVVLQASASQRSARSRTVSLGMLTGTCLRVRVTGLAPGTSNIPVKIMASFSQPMFASQLHLGLASSTSAEKYQCVRPGQPGASHGQMPHCLLPSFDGKGRRKSWRVPVHRVAPGQTSFENLYILSRAPVPVTCLSSDERRCIKTLNGAQRAPISVTLTFSIKATNGGIKAPAKAQPTNAPRRSTTRKKSKKTAAKTIVPRRYMVAKVTALPMVGAISPDLDMTGIPLSGSVHSISRSQPLRHLFHGNVFNKIVAAKLKASGKAGLRGVQLQYVQERPHSDRLGEVEFKTLATYSLILPKPVPFGKTGTFKGAIMGKSLTSPSIHFFSHVKGQAPVIFAGNPDGLRKSATLQVFAFSKQAFRAKLTDTLCQFDIHAIRPGKRPRCQKVLRLEVEIIQPFPQFYTANDSFQTVDSVGAKLFRKYELPTMVKHSSAAPSKAAGAGQRGGRAAGAPASSDGSSVAAAMGAKCSCSCQEKARFEALQAQRMKLPVGSPPPPGYTRLMPCHFACQASYRKCKSAQKSACDCSCEYRTKMIALQRQLAKESKPMTPALRAFFKCSMMCAMAHAKCFK